MTLLLLFPFQHLLPRVFRESITIAVLVKYATQTGTGREPVSPVFISLKYGYFGFKDMLYKHYDFLLDTISIPDRPCSLRDGREMELKIFDIPSYVLNRVDMILTLGVLRGKEIADALIKRGIHDEYFNPKIKVEDETPPPFPLITWKAADADFAELIKALYDKGYIEAGSMTDALASVAPHFSGVSPKAKNLTQGIVNRRDLGNAGKFDSIPNAGKSKKEP